MNLIHVKNLSKTFKVAYRDSGLKASIKSFFKRKYKYVKAVDNISFDIKKGEIVGYIGPNGAGKSTTIKMLSGILTPDEGELLIDGMVPSKNRTAYVKEIGVVFQKTELFSGTIEENILWGNPDATHEEVVEACKIAQANDFIESFSEGYNTMIASKGTSLSGGQKQRLAIARAILRKPKILIFDDATSALDLATEAKLYKALRENLQDVTILLVAQRVASAKTASKIAVIDNGYLAALGTNDELLESSKIYQDIYNSQLKQGGVDNE